MDTLTPNKSEKVDPTATEPAPGRRGSRLWAAWLRLSSVKGLGGPRAGRLPLVLWAGFVRAVVLAADYLLAFITAMVVIPSLGAWLHAQTGVSQGALTGAGTIAMWLMPLLFLVALLAFGEVILMRGMWRGATRLIERVQGPRAEETATSSKAITRSSRRSTKNRKRSA